MTKGERQIAGGVGIKSKFYRLYEGEEYKSQSKLDSLTRMAGKKKFLTTNGFRHTSGKKLSSCAGDWTDTFQRKPPVYIPEREPRGPRQKKEEFKSRLVYTQPPKNACGSPFSTPNIHFTKFQYASSPYDSAEKVERARTAEGRRKVDGKPAFKTVSMGKSVLLKPIKSDGGDSGNGTGAADSGAGASRPGTVASSTDGTRKKGGGEDDGEMKPFIPSHTTRSGAEYSTFSHFPVRQLDPYDDKTLRSAQSTGRMLPMTEQLKDLPEVIRERRPWSPTSPAKTMYTRVLDPGN